MRDRSTAPVWPIMPLREVATIQTGFAIGGTQSVHAIERPYVRVANVQDGYLDLSEMKTAMLPPTKLSRFELQVDDLLLTEGGDFDKLGRGALWPGTIPGCLHQNHVFAVRADRSRLLPGFLAALTASSYGRKYFLSCSKQSTNLASINSTQLKAFPVLLPPLSVQAGIVAILDEWDSAISGADSLLAANRRRLSWVQSQVLTGSVRLSGFDRAWSLVRLSDVLHEHGSRSTGREPVYSVSVSRGLVDQIQHLGRSFAAAKTCHYNRVKPGDIVYTKSPTGNFPLGIIKQSAVNRDVIVSPLYGVFTPRSRDLGTVLDAYFSSSHAAKRYLAPLVQKGAKNTIAVTNTQFLQGTINLPHDEAEVRTLAGFVEVCRMEIRKLEEFALALRRQKRGLVEKLLTSASHFSGTAEHVEAVA
jgi:type I restriction enzyme S subunit